MQFPMSFVFDGHIQAVSALTVTRPGDNFSSAKGSDKMGRLPRLGPKAEDTQIYFPATTLRRLVRESARDSVRRALQSKGEEHPFTLQTHYMLTQGVDITNKVLGERNSGLVSGGKELRQENPLLSLFGRWRLAAHFDCDNAIPSNRESTVHFIAGTGARQNDFIRDPAQAEFLSVEELAKLHAVIESDSLAAKDANAIKESIAALKKRMKDASTDEKNQLRDEIQALESEIDAIKANKVGAEESIQRPLEGYEAIIPGTLLKHTMRLRSASQLELGLLLASLKETARRPFVGGHKSAGAGEIMADYEVTTFPPDADKPVVVGRVKFSYKQGLEIEGELLLASLAAWQAALKDANKAGLNFDRYLTVNE